jgi:SWI/SNF-related matrix-associated actin-dependent regulator of chromatin subfamily A member 5
MEALNWLLKLHSMSINGILADEMGLGKTIQTISLIAHLHLQNKNLIHLVIVPKVTIKNWQRELTKWLPELKVLFFYGDKEQRKHLVDVELKARDFNLVLTTFECAMKEKTPLAKIKYEYLIIDEAHRIKNEKAKFSTVVRQFKSNHRLLLTGTPLQNNLHELWALLNFLMPNIFNDSEEFDKIFNLDAANTEDQMKIVKQIHHLLRPFVLRRLKSEIEFKLPSKKEIYLYVGLSELQKEMYKKILTKNIDVVNGVSKDKIQLLNILMQLKKVCNHPYLFPKVEKGPPYIEGEHLIYNAMKLKILDVLLKKIYTEGGKVLIFSQMTTLLNILDDYCRYRGFRYCRIDGSTSSEDRDTRIEDFQSPLSDKFIFLLSTRAGGLGINLHAANVVIIYDSDWNPQVDLQAIDRAHRIGQTRPVTIYRFVTEGTVEEKIVERAAKKLKIDHLIIQRGKAVQNKVSAIEMTSIIQYGADKLFNTEEDTNDKNIEDILKYSINKTEKVNEHLK